MHRTKRESSSDLGLILRAKDIDQLLEHMNDSEEGSEESREVLDEIIRRAALYTELTNKVTALEAKLKTRTVVVAPDSPRGQ